LKLRRIWDAQELANVGARLAGSCELAGGLPDLEERARGEGFQQREVNRDLFAQISWAQAQRLQRPSVEQENLTPAARLLLPMGGALKTVVN
jgi:hypothetical protein